MINDRSTDCPDRLVGDIQFSDILPITILGIIHVCWSLEFGYTPNILIMFLWSQCLNFVLIQSVKMCYTHMHDHAYCII